MAPSGVLDGPPELGNEAAHEVASTAAADFEAARVRLEPPALDLERHALSGDQEEAGLLLPPVAGVGDHAARVLRHHWQCRP